MQRLFFLFLFFISASTNPFAESYLINSTPLKEPQDLYIDLIIKTITNTIYQDDSMNGEHNPRHREIGYDHPRIAHTMVGIKRLKNIHDCMKEILENNIPGDCIETGVWRGGATILMRAILKAYNNQSKKVWVADSFAGLPPPNEKKYPHDKGLNLCNIPYLAVSLEEVQENFRRYGLLDTQVVFLKGFFSDTLPFASIEKLCLLRLDGDLYESTMDGLNNLYPKLSVGGFVIIDDFGAIGACAQAVQDYRTIHNITEPMKEIDFTGVYWKKEKEI